MASAINKLSVTKIAKLVKDSEPGLTADGGRYADQQMGHGDLAVALLVRRQAQIDGPGQHQYPHSSGGPRTRRQGQQLLWVDPWVDLAVTSENPDGEVFAAVEDEIGLIEEAEDREDGDVTLS